MAQRLNRQPLLDTAFLHRGTECSLNRACLHHRRRAFAQGAMGVRAWKEKPGMAMRCPESTQRLERHLRQNHIAILSTLAVANVHPMLGAVHIAHFQS